MFKGIAAGLAAGALWGLVFVAPRMLPGLSSIDLGAGRFISFGLLSAFMMLLVGQQRVWPTAQQALAALGMSLLGSTGYFLLLVWGIQDAGSEVPALIIGTIPIWVMLLGKPAHLKWAALLPGLLLTLCGIGLMTYASAGAALAQQVGRPDFMRGVLLAVGSMACWTLYAVLNVAWLKRHPQVNATAWTNRQGLITGVCALALWLAWGTEGKVLLALDNKALIAIVCLAIGIGSSWIATVFWNVASRRLSASLCGQLIVSETLFALLFSFLWDAALPSGVQWAAALLFTLGILASIRAHR